jgi:hypothetical protein
MARPKKNKGINCNIAAHLITGSTSNLTVGFG